MTESRRITMLAFPDVQILDVTGPLEVFAMANRGMAEAGLGHLPRYAIELVAAEAGPIRSSGGLTLVAEHAMAGRRDGIDTMLLPGGSGVHAACADLAVLNWVRAAAAGARRVCSVCTGTFLLAAAGLLDGRRATTHWRSAALLAERYPGIRIEADAIAVKDGPIYSSAGVTAGMDLALSLVEEDLGPAMAQAIARNLVLYLRRPGGQSQFSAALAAQAARTDPIRAVQAWILANLEKPLRVPDLAERAAMSPRNFARIFAAEMGQPPGHFIERARIDAARRLLSEPGDGIDRIATRVGFGGAETMRRAFLRQLGISPADYRARFRPAAGHATIPPCS